MYGLTYTTWCFAAPFTTTSTCELTLANEIVVKIAPVLHYGALFDQGPWFASLIVVTDSKCLRRYNWFGTNVVYQIN